MDVVGREALCSFKMQSMRSISGSCFKEISDMLPQLRAWQMPLLSPMMSLYIEQILQLFFM
jgi:hypothetical protein